jgi:hypothetical protein
VRLVVLLMVMMVLRPNLVTGHIGQLDLNTLLDARIIDEHTCLGSMGLKHQLEGFA